MENGKVTGARDDSARRRSARLRGDELADRLVEFGVRVIRMTGALPKNYAGKHVAQQLLRSATSAGANYEEARGAGSKRDFVHKVALTLKELKESGYWLRLVCEAGLLAPKRAEPLSEECAELCAIMAKSLKTARASVGQKG